MLLFDLSLESWSKHVIFYICVSSLGDIYILGQITSFIYLCIMF